MKHSTKLGVVAAGVAGVMTFGSFTASAYECGICDDLVGTAEGTGIIPAEAEAVWDRAAYVITEIGDIACDAGGDAYDDIEDEVERRLGDVSVQDPTDEWDLLDENGRPSLPPTDQKPDERQIQLKVGNPVAGACNAP